MEELSYSAQGPTHQARASYCPALCRKQVLMGPVTANRAPESAGEESYLSSWNTYTHVNRELSFSYVNRELIFLKVSFPRPVRRMEELTQL